MHSNKGPKLSLQIWGDFFKSKISNECREHKNIVVYGLYWNPKALIINYWDQYWEKVFRFVHGTHLFIAV